MLKKLLFIGLCNISVLSAMEQNEKVMKFYFGQKQDCPQGVSYAGEGDMESATLVTIYPEKNEAMQEFSTFTILYTIDGRETTHNHNKDNPDCEIKGYNCYKKFLSEMESRVSKEFLPILQQFLNSSK